MKCLDHIGIVATIWTPASNTTTVLFDYGIYCLALKRPSNHAHYERSRNSSVRKKSEEGWKGCWVRFLCIAVSKAAERNDLRGEGLAYFVSWPHRGFSPLCWEGMTGADSSGWFRSPQTRNQRTDQNQGQNCCLQRSFPSVLLLPAKPHLPEAL